MRADSIARFPTRPNRTILVYPPERSLNRGASVECNLRTTSEAPPRRAEMARREAVVFSLLAEMIFSTNGRSSFARATVVVMPSEIKSERAKLRKSATRCPFLRPSVRIFLWCFIPLEVGSSRFRLKSYCL